MTHLRDRLVLRKDLKHPHSESSVSGSVRDPRISRPSSIYRHMAEDSHYSAPLGLVRQNRQGQNRAFMACLARRKDKETPTKLIHPGALRKILSSDWPYIPVSFVSPHEATLLSIARQASTISAFAALYCLRAPAQHHATRLVQVQLDNRKT